MTNTEEGLDMLTPGSNWFNNRNQKLVTALFITNTAPNLSPKFLAANPPQVVFLTDSGLVLSISVQKFLDNHTFYNVNVDAEALVSALINGESAKSLSQAEPEPDPEKEVVASKITAADVEQVHRAKLDRPVNIQFLTVEEDTRRRAPLLSSEALQEVLLSVEQEPIIVDRNGGLSNVGTRVALVFSNAPDFDKVVESVFDPASVTANYAGFNLDGTLFQIDAYLGTSVQYNRAGSQLVVHLAQLDEQEEDEQEQRDSEADIEFADDQADTTTQVELAPPVEAPKDFSALAATLASQAKPEDEPPAAVQAQSAAPVTFS